MNIACNLEQSARFFPDKTAIIYNDQATTFQDLHLKVNQLASGMRRLGIEKGDRIALFMPNIPEFIIVYFAAQKLGAIAVALNVQLKTDEVRHILDDSGARIIFAAKEQATQIPKEGLDVLERVILVDGDAANENHISRIADPQALDFKAENMNAGDPAVILYTSGTTGLPKGATLTQSNIVSNVNATTFHSGIKKEDVLHLFLPLFHCFGQNFIMNSSVKQGATLVMHQRFEPEPVLNAIARHKVTMFFAVPTIYIYFLNMKDREPDLSSIRYFFTAAAVMPREVADAWHARYKMPIHDGYGLTECSPFASYNHDVKHKPGSIGYPIMNVEMKIVDEEGNEVSQGKWGEICIKGPNVMKGYWRRPEETARTIRDGWLFTGDVGAQDEEGYYFIVDRVKDMIISAGNNIYPAEVENVLYSHPAVLETAVFAMPDPIKGESVKAAVVLQPGMNPTPEELIEYCRAKMAKYKAPKQIVFVDGLPKSATGKILKRILREAV
ncbi:MAG: long-chain fatty acid--CoA ligase [Pseudomonadota bacterium]